MKLSDGKNLIQLSSRDVETTIFNRILFPFYFSPIIRIMSLPIEGIPPAAASSSAWEPGTAGAALKSPEPSRSQSENARNSQVQSARAREQRKE